MTDELKQIDNRLNCKHSNSSRNTPSNIMPKICVFCGAKPEFKTKEHIIPQWLIRFTGDPGREINLGIDTRFYKATGSSKLRTFNFNSFHFPACESCNVKFSELEGKVSQYVSRIFDKDYFINSEIDELLDWFDKIRIGLWLGSLTLDEMTDVVSPKNHISRRIGTRDRALFVYELAESKWKGVQFIGFNTPGFQFIPSCFTLRINNIYFFNYSFDFLFSKRIGFPYPKIFAHTESEMGHMVVEFEKGTRKISPPLINQKFIPAANFIYQPILAKEILGSEQENEWYGDSYVKNNCLDYPNGKGDIFYVDRGIRKLDADTELQLYSNSQKLNSDYFPNRIARQTLETLLQIIKAKPQTQFKSEENRSNFETNRLAVLNAHLQLLNRLKTNVGKPI